MAQLAVLICSLWQSWPLARDREPVLLPAAPQGVYMVGYQCYAPHGDTHIGKARDADQLRHCAVNPVGVPHVTLDGMNLQNNDDKGSLCFQTSQTKSMSGLCHKVTTPKSEFNHCF